MVRAAAVCLLAAPAAAQDVRFVIEPMPATLAALAKRFTPGQIDLLEKLNRRDREHLLRLEPVVPGLVAPATWSDDELVFSPLPQAWTAAELLPKAIVVDQVMQVFGAYENGRLVRWGPVSSGRRDTPTPEGSFSLPWRARSRRSTDNAAWLLEWYFNFVNERGVSFHQFELPGYAASHACVRLLERDAKWLYKWGDEWTLDDTRRHVTATGTPVLIAGAPRYDGMPPWTDVNLLSVPVTLPDKIR